MFYKQKQFARKHVVLTAANHFAAGFGLAIIFQQYLFGDPFLPATVGWLLVSFAIVVHLYEWFR